MVDAATCPHCGDLAHTSLCKQALSTRLADQRVEQDEQTLTVSALMIEVAELRSQVHQLTVELHQL